MVLKIDDIEYGWNQQTVAFYNRSQSDWVLSIYKTAIPIPTMNRSPEQSRPQSIFAFKRYFSSSFRFRNDQKKELVVAAINWSPKSE